VTTLAETPKVTEPGVYDMPAEQYHADPVPGGSLSSSGARDLLPPSCPALFAYKREHHEKPKRIFDYGHAAHDRILGGGPEIVVVEALDWRTSKAKAAAAEARERGAVPILKHEDAQIDEMAARLREHPVASRLLAPDNGAAEASLFWRDERTGVQRRARLDLLPHRRDGRMILPDYKSAVSSEPTKFAKAAADLGYHQQADWYSEAVRALELADDVAFLFVVQEKQPPYIVTVVQLDVVAMRIGAHLNQRAIDTYAECTSTGVWPGYSAEVASVSLPPWYERAHEEDF
jgi:hypothetical protein